MRRYLYSGSLSDIRRVDTDVVIVGCGVAGLYSALSLEPSIHCVILNKIDAKHSNSMYAQGGIAAVIEPNPEQDDPDKHYADTLAAGAGLCDEKAVRVLVNEAWSDIEHLIELGVPFDRRGTRLLLTREGGHGKNRILHCGGDATGLHLTDSLYTAALERNNISIMDRMFLTDILTNEDGVTGVLTLDKDNMPCFFAASRVIIASGGIGRIYRNSTNAVGATGDGIAAAARAGAILKDMEFVQFHPTAFTHPNEEGRFFLISEALRGEGAILRNRRGEAFMQGVHPLADLAPRDIVTRAIISEMKEFDIPNVYLDITTKSRDFLKNRFPTIYAECMVRCVDIAKDWIPVMPVQHYFMGGIATDLDGQTNIPGLYACGEAACTGVHGANRLASNSLLECLVFGRHCSSHISRFPLRRIGQTALRDSLGSAKDYSDVDYALDSSDTHESCVALDSSDTQESCFAVDFESYISEIRTLITRKCGIIRSGRELLEAEVRIHEICMTLDSISLKSPLAIEAYNQSQIALAVLRASILRKTSVGAHYRCEDENEGGNHHADQLLP